MLQRPFFNGLFGHCFPCSRRNIRNTPMLPVETQVQNPISIQELEQVNPCSTHPSQHISPLLPPHFSRNNGIRQSLQQAISENEVIQSPRLADTMSIQTSTDQQRIKVVDVAESSRLRRQRSLKTPISPASMASSLSPTTTLTIQDATLGEEIIGRSPRLVEGQYVLHNGSFVRDTAPTAQPDMIMPKTEYSNQNARPSIRRINTSSSSDSVKARPSLTIDTSNTRKYASLNHQSRTIVGMSACQVETPGSGRTPIETEASIKSNCTANVGTDSRISEDTNDQISPASEASNWVIQSLSARPPHSATSTAVNNYIAPTEIETPITSVEREPVSATFAKLVASDIRLRKIVQAVEERSKLERRLLELENLITSKQEMVQTGQRESPTPIEIVSDGTEIGSEHQRYRHHTTTTNSTTQFWSIGHSSITQVPPQESSRMIPTQPTIGSNTNLQNRLRLPRLQTQPRRDIVVLPSPESAVSRPSVISRFSSWIMSSSENTRVDIQASPRPPSDSSATPGSSNRYYQFVQAHHLLETPISPHPRITCTTASPRRLQRPRAQNLEDILAIDPAPPYQFENPDPSPSFSSLTFGSDVQSRSTSIEV